MFQSLIPLDDEPLEKFSHHFEEGTSRVRVKADGRTGKLESINAHGGHNVRLDSGHFIECRRDEIEPSDFPSHEYSHEPANVGGKVRKGTMTLAEANAERVQMTREAIARQDAAFRLINPFAFLGDEPLTLPDENQIQKAARSLNPFNFLDEETAADDTLRKAAHEHEQFVDDLIEKAVSGLRAGENIVLPAVCKLPLTRVSSIAAAVKAGRICFDRI